MEEIVRENAGRILYGKSDVIPEYYLDDIRIGLSLDSISRMPDKIEIDVASNDDIDLIKMGNKNINFLKDEFYLASTLEKFSLPNNIIGIINTRSKYARIGIETVNSSWFVIPNFGQEIPTPIILEIKSHVDILNVNVDDSLAYLLLFELDVRITPKEVKNYLTRFPFSSWTK